MLGDFLGTKSVRVEIRLEPVMHDEHEVYHSHRIRSGRNSLLASGSIHGDARDARVNHVPLD
jgi:hypothetical protein